MRRSTEREPRSRDEAIEELFQQARKDGFTPKETGELWSQLGAITGAASGGGDGAPSPAGGPAAGAGSIWSAKMIAALALGGSVVAGGGLALTRMPGWAWQKPAAAASSGSRVETPSNDRDAPAAVQRGAAVASPGVDGNGAAASVPGAALPPARSTLSSALPSDWPTRPPGPRRILPAGAQVPAGTQPRAATDAVETTVQSGEANVQSGEAPERTPAPPAAPPPNEGELLLRARRELGSSPTETLSLTEQHAKLFPAGTLIPEREVLAIEALAQLGRSSAARARLADFRASFPHSPHLARLEAIVGR
jgi:hypothetical protein